MVQIVEFTEEYAEGFRNLNLEWLTQYNLLESHDLMILDEPRKNVLERGGFIYLALYRGEPTTPESRRPGDPSAIHVPDSSREPLASPSSLVIGSAALLHEDGNIYELAKMTVAAAFRGQGISKLLLEQCLRKAREVGAGKLILWSNDQLQTAIRLYTDYGFRHVPVVDSPFVTANVKMELISL